MSKRNCCKIPARNMYTLPVPDLFVFLSNPKDKHHSNQIIYKGIKPHIKIKDPQNSMVEFMMKLEKQNKKKFNIVVNAMKASNLIKCGNIELWIDAQNWDYPGTTKSMKTSKRQYLSHVLCSLYTLTQLKINEKEVLGKFHAVAVCDLEHGKRMIQQINVRNLDQILNRCLVIFEQMEQRRYASSRTVFPDPKYMIHANEARARTQQWNLGKIFLSDLECSMLFPLVIHSTMGNWTQFKEYIDVVFGENVNFNTILLGELEAPLLFVVLSGHGNMVHGKPMQFEFSDGRENDMSLKREHLRIAQYMIDKGLDVNIQNKFGYTMLAEAVINEPDLEFAHLLLKNGADPNIYNIFCSTALHSASMQLNVECVKLLCKYGANPLLYNFQGYQVLDISSARGHIEISTILHNQVRKIKESKLWLEYEDTSYCFVCCKSNKNKNVKLYRCVECEGPEKYCSHQCQKRDWKRHKKLCDATRMKIQSMNNIKEKRIVFIVEYFTASLHPSWRARTQMTENVKDIFDGVHGIINEVDHDEYRRKRKKKCRKEYKKHMRNQSLTSLYPPSGIRTKFVVKIQIFPDDDKYILCYDKSRDYKVVIYERKQKKKYRKLFAFIYNLGIDTNNAKKGYFCVFVDAKKKIHIFVDQMVAAQPW